MTKSLALVVVLAGTALAQPKPADKPVVKPDKPADKPAPAAPKPPQELADLVKSMGGSWKCEGVAVAPDGKSQDKVKMTITSKADLDGFWVHDTMAGGSAKGPAFKMETFTTFDSSSRKWRRVALLNDGAQMVGTSDGMKDMKMDFMLDTASVLGAGQFKDHIDASNMHKGVRQWGEISADRGKTWAPVYDIVCKR